MYGLTDNDRLLALDKIKRQKKYLSENGVEIFGQSYRLIDFFKNSFINSDRYIAEINNRVNSLYRYAKDRNLTNIFLTITLPSEYHPKRSIYNKHGKLVKIEDNPKYINDEAHTHKEASKELSRLFHRIQQLRAYRDISTKEKVYFRVFEPHKDGTPHLHASIFIPKDKVDSFVESATRWAKLNGLTQFKIETDIKNPIAYLMKYILKTFDDLREDEDNISDLTLWYIRHGICRFYSSRTLISLEIYRKFGGSHDLYEVTKMYENQEISILIDDRKKPVLITHGNYVIYNRKPVNIKKRNYEPVPKVWKSREKPYIDATIDKIPYIYHKYQKRYIAISDLQKPISKMTFLERHSYRNSLYEELNNPFNDLDDLNIVEDKLVILDRYEAGLI